MDKHEKAYQILQQYRLLERLSEIGAPSVIGSTKMELMVSNDIDIDVDNSEMSLARLYELTHFILDEFHPTWYEAKEEVNADGKTVWFQGFEAILDGELWNFDIWFFDSDTIRQAERYCENIIQRIAAVPGAREAILSLKKQLLEKELYSFGKYTSMDVYSAVLDRNIFDLNTFLSLTPL